MSLDGRYNAVPDQDSGTVKLGQAEPVEVFVQGAGVILQQRDGLLLTCQQSVDAIGAIVHAGRVAGERDIAGQLIELAADGQVRSGPL